MYLLIAEYELGYCLYHLGDLEMICSSGGCTVLRNVNLVLVFKNPR